LNHLTKTKALKIGQQIKVPSAVVSSLGGIELITHTLQKGETLASLAKQYHVDIDTLKAYNNIQDTRKLQIGQKLEVPLSKNSVVANNQISGKKMVTYRVKRGDSLSKIASAFGVSVSQLKEWNKVDDGLLLYPGNRIKVWY
jgi:membrane-bound lytic murein transglycosylase D